MGREALKRGRVEEGGCCAPQLSFPGALAWRGQTPDPVLHTGPSPKPRSLRPWFPRPSTGLSQAPGGGDSFWGPGADPLLQGPGGHREGRRYESPKALCQGHGPAPCWCLRGGFSHPHARLWGCLAEPLLPAGLVQDTEGTRWPSRSSSSAGLVCKPEHTGSRHLRAGRRAPPALERKVLRKGGVCTGF